jgi:predicted nuclease of restriction endonuclease-like RecB superfamily
MEKFKYKEYTDEETVIYDNAMKKIIEAYQNGLSYKEACSVVNIEDSELRRFIFEDALKVMIADLHFSKGITLPDVADRLKVSMRSIIIAYNEMIEDVGISAAEEYRMNNSEGPVGNA